MHQEVGRALLEERVTLYSKAWEKRDHEMRRSMLNSVMESSARYTDPKVDFMSVAELSNYIGQIHAKWPGLRIVRAGSLDSHHNVARFTWLMVPSEGAAPLEQSHVAEFSDNGKICRIIGFIEAKQVFSA